MPKSSGVGKSRNKIMTSLLVVDMIKLMIMIAALRLTMKPSLWLFLRHLNRETFRMSSNVVMIKA